ncbi:MAG: ergothioneine biosynthesis protein EgtB [Pseudomonadota bacterium]
MSIEVLREEFAQTRARSIADCAPLELEDYTLQAAVFASPPKWHLAHTTWFFETFLLKPFVANYKTPNTQYEVLFNSYYNGIGQQHPRDRRGLLSRPGLATVLDYRRHVDEAMAQLLESELAVQNTAIGARCHLGIEHERQHQELLFTDIKYSLAANPLYPAFRSGIPERSSVGPVQWLTFDPGLIEIGHGGQGFSFDNEHPRHAVFVQPFEIADRLVTNGEYQAFVDDGGYQRPELWLADGWATVQDQAWKGPLHWVDRGGDGDRGREHLEFTLHGLIPRDEASPVCHVSGYEADAFARWAGARLPTESEWEWMCQETGEQSSGRDSSDLLHPRSSVGCGACFGACWQWTQSAYGPYPGFRPSDGAIGEYNGKFMSNQWVLRGGSCVTWSSQARPTYRNFFYPQDRWQFSGIRLAR